MVAMPVPVDDPGEDLARAERDLAELDRVVAGLYATPITGPEMLAELAVRRSELEGRLMAARRRVLEYRLARITEDYSHTRSARQLTLAVLAAAEAMHARAAASLSAAQQRARHLRSHEEMLLERRRSMLEQLDHLRAS